MGHRSRKKKVPSTGPVHTEATVWKERLQIEHNRQRWCYVALIVERKSSVWNWSETSRFLLKETTHLLALASAHLLVLASVTDVVSQDLLPQVPVSSVLAR